MHHWRETHRGKIVIHNGLIKLFQVGAGKSKKLAKRQAANKMIQVWFPFKKAKIQKHMDFQRLRDAPVENEDAFQHIDDDMLAQVIYGWNF